MAPDTCAFFLGRLPHAVLSRDGAHQPRLAPSRNPRSDLTLTQGVVDFRAEIQGLVVGRASDGPTLREQAEDYQRATKAVRSGGAPEEFWAYVQDAEIRRQAWQQHKAWTQAFHSRAVGISAQDWCLIAHRGEPLARVTDCAQIADRDEWLTRMPEEKGGR